MSKMASNPSFQPVGGNRNSISMLESLKLTLEAEDKEIQDLRKALQAKEEENLILKQENAKLSGEVSKLKKELIELEARKEAEADKKMNQLGRLILTSLKMSFGGSDKAKSGSQQKPGNSLSEMLENGDAVGDTTLKEVMKYICEESSDGSSDSQSTTDSDRDETVREIDLGQDGRGRCYVSKSGNCPKHGKPKKVSSQATTAATQQEIREEYRMIQIQIYKILQILKSSYVGEVEDLLARTPNGLEAIEFQQKHQEIVKEIGKLLETEIRRVSQVEPLEAHLKSLQSYARDNWKYALEENNRNLRKGKDRHEQQQEWGRLRSLIPQKREGQGDMGQTLPPLVFQLQHRRIKMGLLIDGKPQILKNDSGKVSTPFIVGLNKQGDFMYGNEVIDEILPGGDFSQSNISKYWWVADHFISNDQGAWTEALQGDEGGLHKITVEFLLAFISKQLKERVETGLKGTCSVAIITVPFWFCSSQRIQVKDGGRLAGFSEVYLVNEASAAAFACASTEQRSSSTNNILVMSENSEHVDASIYALSSYGKKITMVGHCGSYSLSEAKKYLSRDKLPPWNGISDDGKIQILKMTCTEAVKQANDPKYNSAWDINRPMDMFVICESDNWKPLLEQVGKHVARKVCDIDQENAAIFGAILLSQNPKEIVERIRDKLAWDVLRKCSVEMANCVISKNDYLPINKKKTSTPFPMTVQEGELFQRVMNHNIRVGSLHMHQAIPSYHRVELHLTINNEAIVELMFVMLSSCKNSSNEYAVESEYTWTTPNLTEEDRARIRSLLGSLGMVKVNHGSNYNHANGI